MGGRRSGGPIHEAAGPGARGRVHAEPGLPAAFAIRLRAGEAGPEALRAHLGGVRDAEAHGENWDAEDEEKQMYASRAPTVKKKEVAITQRAQPQNDDLVTTREAGPRERLDELQGKPEARVVVVEEDEGQGIKIGKGGGSAPAKAEAEAPEEKGGRRRDDFYLRAGGGGP